MKWTLFSISVSHFGYIWHDLFGLLFFVAKNLLFSVIIFPYYPFSLLSLASPFLILAIFDMICLDCCFSSKKNFVNCNHIFLLSTKRSKTGHFLEFVSLHHIVHLCRPRKGCLKLRVTPSLQLISLSLSLSFFKLINTGFKANRRSNSSFECKQKSICQEYITLLTSFVGKKLDMLSCVTWTRDTILEAIKAFQTGVTLEKGGCNVNPDIGKF